MDGFAERNLQLGKTTVEGDTLSLRAGTHFVVVQGNLTLTSGNLVLTSGTVTLTSGGLTLTSGNLTLTSGDLTLTSGDLTLTSGDLTLTSGEVTISGTSVDNALTLSTTPGTATDGSLIKAGTSASPIAFSTAGQYGIKAYVNSTATSGFIHGMYLQAQVSGAGGSGIAVRPRVYLSAAGENAYGMHATLENEDSDGYITGLGCGARLNLVLADAALHSGGTYYGALVEIFSNGASSSVAAVTKHAILGIAAAGNATGADTVKNAIAFDGVDGSGSMIYTHTHTPGDAAGSVRVLINGVAGYMKFWAAE